MTINMRRYLSEQPRTKRAKKAARYVKDRVAHYTKTDYDKVKITTELNNEIVKRYRKRMTPLKLRISLDNGVATVKRFAEEKKPEPAAAKKGGKPEQKAGAAAPAKK